MNHATQEEGHLEPRLDGEGRNRLEELLDRGLQLAPREMLAETMMQMMEMNFIVKFLVLLDRAKLRRRE